MKSVAGTLKIDLAQFRDLEAFATFGSELDAVSAAQLGRGYRLVELLKQGLNSPMAVEEQVIALYAGINGYLDDLPVEDVQRFEAELIDTMKNRHSGLVEEIRSSGAMPEDQVKAAVVAFKASFETSQLTADSGVEA
jgi:F-type H+-transporting ATPase subunit alpha